jgi:hypothetical protein
MIGFFENACVIPCEKRAYHRSAIRAASAVANDSAGYQWMSKWSVCMTRKSNDSYWTLLRPKY